MYNEFCEITGITEKVLKSKSRVLPVALARAALFWLMYRDGWKYTEIGREFNRDHSTVVYSVHMVNNAYRVGDKRITGYVDKVKNITINKAMSDLKQILEITPPKNQHGMTETHEVTFQLCGSCGGTGGCYIDSYSAKFEPDFKEKYVPCPCCGGTGKVKAIIKIEFTPHGEVKEEYKNL